MHPKFVNTKLSHFWGQSGGDDDQYINPSFHFYSKGLWYSTTVDEVCKTNLAMVIDQRQRLSFISISKAQSLFIDLPWAMSLILQIILGGGMRRGWSCQVGKTILKFWEIHLKILQSSGGGMSKRSLLSGGRNAIIDTWAPSNLSHCYCTLLFFSSSAAQLICAELHTPVGDGRVSSTVSWRDRR